MRGPDKWEEAMGVLKAIPAAFVAALSLLTTVPAWAEPIKIRVSYVVPVANWPPMLAVKKDLAKPNVEYARVAISSSLLANAVIIGGVPR